MSEGFDNITKVSEKPWIQSGIGDFEVDQILKKLKTISTLDPKLWHRLATEFKRRQWMDLAEYALIGARYCDFSSKELMEEWLGVFTFNRWNTNTPEEILKNANICDGGMCDVANHPGRQLEELQSLLFQIETRKATT